MKPMPLPRFIRTLRYIIRDLCWMVSYISLTAAVAGVGRAVWLIIDETLRRAQ